MNKYINEQGEHMISMTLDERGPLTDEEKEMLRKARQKSPVFDEDCPPMSDALHRQVQNLIAAKRKMARQLIPAANTASK